MVGFLLLEHPVLRGGVGTGGIPLIAAGNRILKFPTVF